MPAGRPTSYRPEFCDDVIELGKQGKSQVQIACGLDVDPKTLRDWAEAHPEFSLALSRAKAFEQDWWENAGQTGMTGDKFNAAVWKKSMEARFRDDYTERREISGGVAVILSKDDADL
jgi:transposase-like protein